MDKTKRFASAFEYLRYNKYFSSQTEASNQSGLSRSNISSALNGNESILTDSFLARFNNAYGNVFNLSWLLTGEGEMLNPSISSHNHIVGSNNQVAGSIVNRERNSNNYNTDCRLVDDKVAAESKIATLEERVKALSMIIEEKERVIKLLLDLQKTTKQ